MSADLHPAREHTVLAEDGTPLHVRVDGPVDAPVLLVCNSLGTDHTMWDAQVPVWAADRCLVRFDQRGHGASGVPPGPYTLDRLGRDATAVLDGLEIDRVDVCGISLGGMVALWLAAHRPERVRRVVAADTAARVGTEEAWRDRAALVRIRGMAAVREAVLDRFFSADFRASGAGAVDRVGDLLGNVDPEGYAASCDALAVADLSDELATITAPVLVIVGDEDVATPPSDARALVAALPAARLEVLPGAGHLANLEAPDTFATLVADHLADHLADHVADHVAGDLAEPTPTPRRPAGGTR